MNLCLLSPKKRPALEAGLIHLGMTYSLYSPPVRVSQSRPIRRERLTIVEMISSCFRDRPARNN